MNALGRIRATILSIVLAAGGMMAAQGAQAQAQSPGYIKLTSSDVLKNRPIYLGVDKSTVIELPRAAGDVLVSNPKIADAVLRTSTRLYLIGVALGQANVFLFDQSGKQMASFEIYVEADLGSLNQLLAEAIPDGFVRASAMNGSIILRGQVSSSSEASRAVEITNSLIEKSPDWVSSTSSSGSASATGAGNTSSTASKGFSPSNKGGPGVINLISITGEEQVALKVTIAEVQREVVKQLGINLKAVIDDTISFSNPTTFPFNTATAGSLGMGKFGNLKNDGFSATVKALEETRMLRTLAEPTLTAVSGETAEFLAGGEFPIPVNSDNGTITVAFKRFGVHLAFTPVVLSAGRINLRVATEVSDLSASGSVSLPISNSSTVSIPGISIRKAETSVELPSGGSFVIAGLVQENAKRAASGLPWLQNLPILGVLFSSKDFLNSQTELVMIVTPYLVKPASPQALAKPGDNMMLSSDAEAYLQNRLTKVYGRAATPPAGAASGQVGFTFD